MPPEQVLRHVCFMIKHLYLKFFVSIFLLGCFKKGWNEMHPGSCKWNSVSDFKKKNWFNLMYDIASFLMLFPINSNRPGKLKIRQTSPSMFSMTSMGCYRHYPHRGIILVILVLNTIWFSPKELIIINLFLQTSKRFILFKRYYSWNNVLIHLETILLWRGWMHKTVC